MSRLTVDDVIARQEIGDLFTRYARGIDTLDRGLFTSIFTDPVVMDLSSWSGIPAAPIKPDAWFDGICARMGGFDATQHNIMNHEIHVDGDRATSRPYIIANHYMIADGVRSMHSIGGYYEHALIRTADGWRIASLKLVVTWEIGDRDLFRRAAERTDKRKPL
jgi:hypothetical protein